MFDHQFSARVALQVAGPLTTTFTTFPRDRGGYLTVGIGPILIYCRTPGPVLTGHRAFTRSLTTARELFPTGYRAPLPGRSQALPGHPVIAAITTQDDEPCTITAYTAGGSRDGRPALIVTVGALTLDIRDLAAARDLHDVWNTALNHAPGLWQPTGAGMTVADQ